MKASLSLPPPPPQAAAAITTTRAVNVVNQRKSRSLPIIVPP
jgi:hypothetical protein